MAFALPPVAATAYPPLALAPTTNLLLKSGVLPVPSHNDHPEGIAFAAPDQITITPEGTASPAASVLILA